MATIPSGAAFQKLGIRLTNEASDVEAVIKKKTKTAVNWFKTLRQAGIICFFICVDLDSLSTSRLGVSGGGIVDALLSGADIAAERFFCRSL